MRKACIVALLVAALAAGLLAFTAGAEVSAPTKVTPKIIAAPAARVLAPPTASIQESFQGLVAKQSWPRDKQQTVLGAFAKLPAGMQQAVAASRDRTVASKLGVATMRFDRSIIARPPFAIKLPHVTSVWPASGDGAPHSYLLVYGIGMNAGCEIWFDGVARTTHYMPWGEDWGDCIGCEIPALALAHDYDLYVKDTAADRAGNHLDYRVVAPRSWRG